jgi:DNA replication and repair protein RecF
MALRSVRIEDFRCIELAELEFDPGTTLIVGPNGSGKTSLLEALFVLGRGRSFRTARLETAIRHPAHALRVVGTVRDNARLLTLGIEHRQGQTTARVGGEPVESLAALSRCLPIQAIDPGVHKLIEEGPVRRRRFLDWGVFHVEQGFLPQWQRFHRALRQRNAALRQAADEVALEAWDRELAAAGTLVAEARRRYLEQIQPSLESMAKRLLKEEVTIGYSQGWQNDADLEQTLASRRPVDCARRMTTAGPHRADIQIRIGGHTAREVVSRGHQKLLAAALILGQLQYHRSEHGLAAVLLLDDPAAELDGDRLKRLVDAISGLKVQIVVTSLRADFDALGKPGRMFHVEQGKVVEMYNPDLQIRGTHG